MTVLVPTAFEWFEEWQEEPKGKRGVDYETLKNTFLEASMSVIMKLFPQLEGKVGADVHSAGGDNVALNCLLQYRDKAQSNTSPKEGSGLCHFPCSPFFASSGGECDWRIPTDQPVLSGCTPRSYLWG